jgi:predicted XRE-type DNA-binding protein
MRRGKLELVYGSGNAFRDLGMPNAGLLQLKALLGAAIIRAMNELALGPREAERVTKIPAADFSRIRKANLARFTADRLMTILNRMGQQVDVTVRVQPKRKNGRVGLQPAVENPYELLRQVRSGKLAGRAPVSR